MKPDVASSKVERRKQGKALREKCPRTSQAEWKPRPKSQDVIKLLEESDVDRIPGLIPLKYQRMAVSPSTFFRGAAIIQARDLANAPVSGITVQACGDCHLVNFGGFASPERKLVFDINDFDETVPWCMGKLGEASSGGQGPGVFPKPSQTMLCERLRLPTGNECLSLPRWKCLTGGMHKLASTIWNAYYRKHPVALDLFSKAQKQARSQTSEAVVPKYTAVVNGHHQIKDNPPVLYHFQKTYRISSGTPATT